MIWKKCYYECVSSLEIHTQKKKTDKYSKIQVSDSFKKHNTERDKNLQNSKEKLNYGLGILVKTNYPYIMKGFIYGLYIILLVYVSVFTPVPFCFN